MNELPVCPQCGQRHVGRGGYIGSGDAAAIIGVSQWRSPVDCYQSKVEPAEDPAGPTAVQQRGLILEPVILDAFERAKGLKVVERQQFREIPGLTFPIGSHIDGRVEDTGALVEAKSAAFGLRDEWGEPGSADVPESYLCQAAHHMAVYPEAPGVWLPVMFVGFTVRLEHFYVPRDSQFVKDIVDAEIAFADKHLIPRIPPPAVTRSDVTRLFPKDAGTAVEASVEVALAVNDLRDLRQRIERMKDEDAVIEGRVAAALGANALLTFEGKTIATFKGQSRKSIDAKALLAAHPELAGQFERETTFRTLRLKK